MAAAKVEASRSIEEAMKKAHRRRTDEAARQYQDGGNNT
jgi:hypothetical protein